MAQIRDENFFVIKGWMINRLKLKGIDLMIYAILYGFTQDGENYYTGGVDYIAKLACCDSSTARRSLKRLVEAELISKEPYEINNVVFNRYRCIAPMQNAQGGIGNLPTNNKYINNQEMNISISKDMSIFPKKTDFSSIIAEWNVLGLTKVSEIRPYSERYRSLTARISEYGEDKVVEAIHKVSESSFLKGENNKGWQITFDWFVKPNNFIKVLEGNYDDRAKGKGDSFMNELAKLYEEGLD